MSLQPPDAVMKKPKLFLILPSAISIAILALAIWSIAVQLRDYRLRDVLAGMEGIAAWQLAALFLLTGLSYGAIAGYDILAFRYIRHSLSTIKVAFAGLITYAISPNVGFAFLTGGALRYRLYSPWQVSPREIAEVIVFSNLSLWVGIFAIAGAVFSWAPPCLFPSKFRFRWGPCKFWEAFFWRSRLSTWQSRRLSALLLS